MNKKYWLIPMFVFSSTFSGWAANSEFMVDQFPCVLEVEHFSIHSGRIVSDQDASNGKAVLSESLNFSARITIFFKETGRYLLTLYAKTTAGSKDSIHIKVNNEPDVRTYPPVAFYGVYAPCKNKVPIVLKEPGKVTVTLYTTNEYGSYYDKAIIDKLDD